MPCKARDQERGLRHDTFRDGRIFVLVRGKDWRGLHCMHSCRGTAGFLEGLQRIALRNSLALEIRGREGHEGRANQRAAARQWNMVGSWLVIWAEAEGPFWRQWSGASERVEVGLSGLWAWSWVR